VIAISAIVLTALRSAGSTAPGLGVAAEISLRIIALVQVRLVFFLFASLESLQRISFIECQRQRHRVR